MANPKTTGDKRDIRDKKTGRFAPGNSLGGRPKGSRHKLGEAFIEALHDDFEQHGPEVIQTVRTEKPDAYLKVVASILPKELNVKVDPLEELTDDQLKDLARTLSAAIGLDAVCTDAEGARPQKTLQ